MKKAQASSDEKESTGLRLISVTHYFKGASLYPPDDQNRPAYLKVGLEVLCSAGTSLKATLPLAKQIQEVEGLVCSCFALSGD